MATVMSNSGKERIGNALNNARPVSRTLDKDSKSNTSPETPSAFESFAAASGKTRPEIQETQSMRQRRNLEVTEDSIAREFVRLYGDQLRFDHSQGMWMIWQDGFWQRDTKQIITDMLRQILVKATARWDGSDKRKTVKNSFIGGAEKLARADPLISVDGDHWDKDPMLLGGPNTTVCLKGGDVRASKPSDFITKSCTVAPAEGDCPHWRQFLTDVTQGDEDLVDFIQVWCGYLLTGLTKEHVLLFIHGPGGNGKSVFLNVIARVLGDYHATAAIDTFTKSRGDRHPTDMAMLCGARSVAVSETEVGSEWSEAKIKLLTGGDSVTARFMRQDFFTFLPQFKLTIVGNHAPALSNVDAAMKRRLRILPFEHTPDRSDPNLEEKLWGEAGQILAWAIRGCCQWQQKGLPYPKAMADATEEYFKEQDTFGAWIEERCDTTTASSFTPSRVLFACWKAFAEDAGEEPGSSKMLGARLRRLGLVNAQKCVDGKNCKGWRGISLRGRI